MSPLVVPLLVVCCGCRQSMMAVSSRLLGMVVTGVMDGGVMDGGVVDGG